MVDFKRLSDRAKDMVEKRGGTDGLKRDAESLKAIAGGKGSLSDKAKAAAEALKQPSATSAGTEGTAAGEGAAERTGQAAKAGGGKAGTGGDRPGRKDSA